MYEYIQSMYSTVFTAADLPAFIAAGWITAEQAAELQVATPSRTLANLAPDQIN